MENKYKKYLGDSVYCNFQNGQLILTTENGLATDPSNRIVLESEVYDALQRYVAALCDSITLAEEPSENNSDKLIRPKNSHDSL